MASNGSSNGNGSHSHKKAVCSEVSRETREALKSTSFDVWKYEDSDEVGFWGTMIRGCVFQIVFCPYNKHQESKCALASTKIYIKYNSIVLLVTLATTCTPVEAITLFVERHEMTYEALNYHRNHRYCPEYRKPLHYP